MGSFNRFNGICFCGKEISFQDKELLFYGTVFEELGGFCPEYWPGEEGPIQDKDCDFPLWVADRKLCECKGIYVARFRYGIFEGLFLSQLSFRDAAKSLKNILGRETVNSWECQLKRWYGDLLENTIFISQTSKLMGGRFALSDGNELAVIGENEVNIFRLPKPRDP